MGNFGVIGVSLLMLTAWGGTSDDNTLSNPQEKNCSYANFVHTHLSPMTEAWSEASLEIGLPNRLFYQTAMVYFLGEQGNLDFGEIDYINPTQEKCQSLGYSQTFCENGTFPDQACPYNSNYFNRCCDSRYKYERKKCKYPNTLSGDSCGGKYMCYCDRALYPLEGCDAPLQPGADVCVEEGQSYYAQCVCPSSYTQTCEGQNIEGVGVGCTQNGVTKYESCRCKEGYNQTCAEMGAVTPSDYCLLNGIKYYNNCKTCENKCTLSSCPEGNVCEYEDCSQKYCAIGCATNYKDLDNYWCNGAMRCWFK